MCQNSVTVNLGHLRQVSVVSSKISNYFKTLDNLFLLFIFLYQDKIKDISLILSIDPL